mgnify:FL=1
MQSIFSGVDTSNFSGVEKFISNLTNLAFFAVGIVSVVFVSVGGLKLITSAGNPEGLKKAKTTITYAIAGLVLAISASAIGNFIIGSVK